MEANENNKQTLAIRNDCLQCDHVWSGMAKGQILERGRRLQRPTFSFRNACRRNKNTFFYCV